jgi:RNA polymerase sigma factor (sigma-70 family)
MTPPETPERLSGITTLWSRVRDAQAGAADAQAELIARYSGAARRYLLAALGDAGEADELIQEFALRFVRGDYHRAAPEYGRFRNYLKTVLFHLVAEFRRKRRRQPAQLPDGVDPPADEDREEQRFRASWRQDLLASALDRLAVQNATFHAVLAFRVEQPRMPSEQMAEVLGTRLNRGFTAEGVRQTLSRARARLGELVLVEVLHTLANATREAAYEELADLNLLGYCRTALDEHFGPEGR